MSDECGRECEIDESDEEEAATAAADQAMREVLRMANTEQLRDELKRKGWRVRLEAES